MGNRPRYHGTGKDFDAFDASKFGESTGGGVDAFSFAVNPELAHPFANISAAGPVDIGLAPGPIGVDPRGITNQARTWADGTPMVIDDNPWTGKVWHPNLSRLQKEGAEAVSKSASPANAPKSKTYLVDTTSGKPTVIGARVLPVEVLSQVSAPLHIPGNNIKASWDAANQAFSRSLPDGRKIDLIDVFNYNAVAGFPQEKITWVQDPTRIRSRFAAFDPSRRNESDLLAGMVPAGFMRAVSTGDNEAHSTRLHVTP